MSGEVEVFSPFGYPLDCDYCDEWLGGSHYHCGNCFDPKPTSMLGHYREGRFTCEQPTDE